MSYAAQQDLIDRFGSPELEQLTDPVNGTTIDATTVDRALTDTDALINSYLEGRFDLPLSVVTQRVLTAACNIARYKLYKDAPPAQVRQAFEDEITWLNLVAAGKAGIGIDAGGDTPPSNDGASMKSDGKTFGRSDSSAFI